jgi:hypothetical protein
MGFSIKNLFRELLKKGFSISWSTGPMFDPRNQKRTSAMDDLLEQHRREHGDDISEIIRQDKGPKTT